MRLLETGFEERQAQQAAGRGCARPQRGDVKVTGRPMDEATYKGIKEAHAKTCKPAIFAPRARVEGIATRTGHPLCWWMVRSGL